MLPPPACFMIGTTFWAAMNSALTLTSMIRSHSASSVSSSGLVRNGRPALAKYTSSRPKRSTVASTAASLEARSATSQRIVSRWSSPCASLRLARPSSLMSSATTSPPSARKRSTAARPMPEPPPVMTQALPVSRGPTWETWN